MTVIYTMENMQSVEKIRKSLVEGQSYNVQLVVCEKGRPIQIISGTIKPRLNAMYVKEDKVVEDMDYPFYQGDKLIGKLVFLNGELVLLYNDGSSTTVGSCAVHITGNLKF